MRLGQVLAAPVFAFRLALISLPLLAPAPMLALLTAFAIGISSHRRDLDLLDLGVELGEHIVISRVSLCHLESVLGMVQLPLQRGGQVLFLIRDSKGFSVKMTDLTGCLLFGDV